jgi:dienelactone hydrolase
MGLALVAAGVAYFALVRHHPLGPAPRAAVPVPAEMDRALTPVSIPLAAKLEAEIEVDGHRVLPVEFQAQRLGEEAPHAVTMHLYFGDEAQGKTPTFVVTPILAGGNEVARLICDDLASHGYHAALVFRDLADGDESFEEIETRMKQLIVDRRRALDWLVERPEVDTDRLGAYGVSLGAITTVMLAAVEPRFALSIAVMPGGDLPTVFSRSVEGECKGIRKVQGLPESPNSAQLEEFIAAGRKVIATDPLKFARYVDPAEILLFNTRRDTSVPTDTQEALWNELGQPERYSLPTGHYGAIVYLPLITSKARKFIASRFAR